MSRSGTQSQIKWESSLEVFGVVATDPIARAISCALFRESGVLREITSLTRYPASVSANDRAPPSLPGPTMAICGLGGIAAAYQAVSPETKIHRAFAYIFFMPERSRPSEEDCVLTSQGRLPRHRL